MIYKLCRHCRYRLEAKLALGCSILERIIDYLAQPGCSPTLTFLMKGLDTINMLVAKCAQNVERVHNLSHLYPFHNLMKLLKAL